MESNEATFFLFYDTLAENGILDIANFLKWPITVIHTHGFTMEPLVEEDGNTEESKNHWAMIIETSSGSFRVSMESRANKKTGKRGVLNFHLLSYTGQSWSAVHRETFV